MARRLADGDMYRLILVRPGGGTEIFGPYDKHATARGVATQKMRRSGLSYGSGTYESWHIDKATIKWEEVQTSDD